ncbi:hypothetical protein [Nocardiopsis valliformis]|uniref:hypothetical protein n=1 Tax=Nocardiopsis valliformis TaxID=239974 RepID=UPI00034BD0A2|nr:hypothetical protein [Nocardiopsis valliformis]
MPESTSLEADSGAFHQIHFAWADPTLLGRVGPGPAATSLPQRDQPVLRSWRDRLIPALTADYRSALPDTDPAAYPETLWARHYPDGQSALVYRWPGDVRQAHAWAIVGPTRGLTFSRILALHENPNTRPAPTRPPTPGWAAMRTLPAPEPWEHTCAPGALRTRDRRAAETRIDSEPILIGAVARALEHPDKPVHITLDPDRADLWQATQLRFLWGMHRILHDILTPRAALPAEGWNWSFSTYDPVLGVEDGPHLAFGPPTTTPDSPFLTPAPSDHLKIADGLVTVLREEGGDALGDHLRARGIPETIDFTDRRALLRDWFDPRPRPAPEPHTREETLGTTDTAEPGDPRGTEEAPQAVRAPEATDTSVPETHREPEETPDPQTSRGSAEDPASGAGETLGAAGLQRSRSVEEPTEPVEGRGFKEPRGTEASAEPPGPGAATEPPTGRSGAEYELTEAPDPFAEDGAQDTSEQETWAGSLGGRPHTFLGVGRRPPPAVEPPEEPVTDPGAGQPLDPPLPPEPDEAWTISASTPPEAPDEEPSAPAPLPETRTPADAPPLAVLTLAETEPPDYEAETEPDTDEFPEDSDDNWPTQYVDLPLSRLERWHSKRGPEGAYTDVVDARAAVRAERSELQRVRDERDHYHTEVQELRREIARLDQSWIDSESTSDTPERRRRWPRVLLLLVLFAAVFAVGLQIGAGTGLDTLGLLALLTSPLTSASWWPL